MTTRLEKICSTLAGERVRVVRQSDCPPEGIWEPGAFGGYSPILSAALEPWLRSTGRWDGPAATIFIDDTAIRAMLGDAPEATIERRLLGVALHETAHVLDSSSGDVHDVPHSVAWTMLQTAPTPPELIDQPGVPPWLQHGANFVRLALHLCHRAWIAGHPVSPLEIFDGGLYALPDATRFGWLLADELEQLERVSLRDLAQHPAPARYVEFWSDLKQNFHGSGARRCHVRAAPSPGGDVSRRPAPHKEERCH